MCVTEREPRKITVCETKGNNNVKKVNSVKVNELPPVCERAANSAYHLLVQYLLRYVCPSFPLMFI